jgi:hypothetical protein
MLLRRHSILANLTVLSLTAGAVAGETLYNGIVLPGEWPPRLTEFSAEPMKVPYLDIRPEVVPIDVGRQLFVDDFLIEKTTLNRTYHHAQYHPDCPILRADKPWEREDNKPYAMVFSDGVWYDPAEKIFKMWYMGGYVSSICYATSKDGLHWEKPDLDVFPGTNMVQKRHRDSTIVWLDLNEQDKSKRFKLFWTFRDNNEWKPGISFSPDGIHWAEPITATGVNGDRSTMFYNPFRGLWVYSLRYAAPVLDRTRHYLECKTLEEGLPRIPKDSRIWTNADRLDPHNPDPKLKDTIPQLYNLDCVAYESLLLGFFAIWEGQPEGGRDKRNELLLGFSRDGFHWHRPDRTPFVGVNETPGAWNYANIQSAGGGCLVIGDRLYFYVSGRGKMKTIDPAVTGLATLRRDGFASMDADKTGGELMTRPVTFKGKYLFVNADVPEGELRVEVLGKTGQIIGPFSKGSCAPISADKTLQRVRWSGASDLSAIAGQTVRFRFLVNNGRLYSFWVSPDESGASYGYVAAGGPGFTQPRDTTGTAAYNAAKGIAVTPPK